MYKALCFDLIVEYLYYKVIIDMLRTVKYDSSNCNKLSNK